MKLSASFCILIISLFQINLTLSDHYETPSEKFKELNKLRADLEQAGIKVRQYVQLQYSYTHYQLYTVANILKTLLKNTLLSGIQKTVNIHQLDNTNHCVEKAYNTTDSIINNGTTLYEQAAKNETTNIIMNSEVIKLEEKWRNITNMISSESDQSSLQCLEMQKGNSTNTLESLEYCLSQKIQEVNSFLTHLSTREHYLKLENDTYLLNNVRNAIDRMHEYSVKTLLKIVTVRADFLTCISV